VSEPFFRAAERDVLVAPRCSACGHWASPYLFYGAALPQCPACDEPALEWTETHGTGTVVSWTVLPGAAPVVDGADAQVSGIVELDEGPWLLAAIDVPVEQLVVGLPVRVAFERPGDGDPVPVFRPA
jgi:uncharacterized OB-fold protein